MHKMALRLTIATFAFIIGTTVSAENTDRWLTDVRTGVRLWNPAPAAGESIEWNGSTREASGHGVAIWKINGVETERAAGNWKAGKLDGYGVWQHRNGDRYEGQWQRGRKHGVGVYTWANGNRFCGRYRENRRQEGAFYHADGKLPGGRIPSPAARQHALEAETSALRARQAAGDARRQAPPVTP